MFSCLEPVAVNVTCSLLASVKGLLEGDSLRPSQERLVNDLGLEGQIVYTEIKVTPSASKRKPNHLSQNGMEKVILQLEEETDNSSE